MLRYGLTGGIASGKSTVAAMLREEGFAVIEADPIAHQLMERSGAAYKEVVELFGEAILNIDGSVNRGRVAAIVFNNPEKLQQLNEIIHPRVALQMQRDFAEYESTKRIAVAFVEAALIFEAGLDRQLDGVVVAWSKPEQQLARLRERGMSEEQARQRMSNQLPVAEKVARASATIDCSGPREETRRQVAELAEKLRARAADN